MFIGDGANGKSVVLAVLAAMLGLDNTVSISLHQLGDKFQTGRLRGKVANIVGDLEDTDKVTEGLLKQLVSGERVKGEFKNRDPFTFVTRARHTFSANSFQRFRDRTNGIWRRVLLFVFDQIVPEEKRDVNLAKDLIRDELPGIFNWALKGARRLQAQGGAFTPSAVCEREFKRYRVDCNPVAAFLAECCNVAEGLNIRKQSLYQTYKEWCDNNSYKALASSSFGRELNRVVPGLREVRPRVEGERVNEYVGIELRDRVSVIRSSRWAS